MSRFNKKPKKFAHFPSGAAFEGPRALGGHNADMTDVTTGVPAPRCLFTGASALNHATTCYIDGYVVISQFVLWGLGLWSGDMISCDIM